MPRNYAAKKPHGSQPLARFIDAMRACLGLGPLYAAERASHYYGVTTPYDPSGFDCDGNRRVGYDRGSLRLYRKL